MFQKTPKTTPSNSYMPPSLWGTCVQEGTSHSLQSHNVNQCHWLLREWAVKSQQELG